MKRSFSLISLFLVLLVGCLTQSRSTDGADTDLPRASVVMMEDNVRMESYPGCSSTTSEFRVSTDAEDDPRLESDLLLVVEKNARRLGIYRHGELGMESDGSPLCFKVALAPQAPPGPKQRSGDHRTPEGWYRLSDDPLSSFENALLIHYPNCLDATRGQERGLIQKRLRDQMCKAEELGVRPEQYSPLGGKILIHSGGFEDTRDWTLGCIALSRMNLGKLRASLPASKKAMILIVP